MVHSARSEQKFSHVDLSLFSKGFYSSEESFWTRPPTSLIIAAVFFVYEISTERLSCMPNGLYSFSQHVLPTSLLPFWMIYNIHCFFSFYFMNDVLNICSFLIFSNTFPSNFGYCLVFFQVLWLLTMSGNSMLNRGQCTY